MQLSHADLYWAGHTVEILLGGCITIPFALATKSLQTVINKSSERLGGLWTCSIKSDWFCASVPVDLNGRVERVLNAASHGNPRGLKVLSFCCLFI